MTRSIFVIVSLLFMVCLGFSAFTPGTRASLQSPERPGEGEAHIWYLGHSGWAIKTQNHLLIFDCQGQGLKIQDPVQAFGGHKRSLFVFVSHDHGDHLTPDIFSWKKFHKTIFYVFGSDFGQEPHLISLRPRQKKTIGDVEILTIRSTDLGVGFLVKTDGLVIFHAGDFENGKGAWDSYVGEVEFLRKHAARLDMAFIPVARDKGEWWTHSNKGSFFFMRTLNPRVVFPMHALGQEVYYREFAKEAARSGLKSDIRCAGKPGDRFIYPGNRTGAAAPPQARLPTI